MATRPSIAVGIRASRDTWQVSTTAIPLIGEDTKTPVPGATKIAEGWWGNEKPAAQSMNYFDNRNDQWVFWVTEGSALALEVPHIKEADSAGNTAFASVTAGATTVDENSATVTPNSGSGETGLFVQTGSSKHGSVFETDDKDLSAALLRSNGATTVGDDSGILRVETFSDGPVAINVSMATSATGIQVVNTEAVGPCIKAQAGPGDSGGGFDGGPALYGLVGAPDGNQDGGLAGKFENIFSSGDVVLMETTSGSATGNVLVVNASNSSIGVKVTQSGGKNPAAKFEAGFDSGHSSAPIQLVPQLDDMVGDGVSQADGSIWIKEAFFSGDTQHHPRFFSGASGQAEKWFSWTNGPMCAIDKYSAGAVGDNDDLFFDIFDGLTLDFDTDAIPADTGVVLIRISGVASRQNDTAEILALQGALFDVYDLTADPGKASPIASKGVDLMPIDIGEDENLLRVLWEIDFEYTLPAAGQRVFLVEARRGSLIVAGTTGSLLIVDTRFHLRPRP